MATAAVSPAATLGLSSPVGDFAQKFPINVALLTKVMQDLGGDLTTPAAVVLAIPQATFDSFLPKLKKPDVDELLSPIEQGIVVHFFNQVKDEVKVKEVDKTEQDSGKNALASHDCTVKVKISEVVDQMDENVFVEPSDGERATYRNNYRTVTGGTPPLKHTPTGAQLGALLHKISRGSAPYVDFAIFNPYGTRMSKIRKFTAQVWIRNQLETKHLTGPGSYDDWLDCWNLFRVAMVSLLAASPQVLDDYASGIRELVTLYPSSWGLVWAADEIMRSEQWGQLKEELVDAKAWPEDRPWDEVIARTTFGKGDITRQHYWNTHVVYPATQSGGGLRTVQALEGTKHIPSVDGLYTGMASGSSGSARTSGGNVSTTNEETSMKKRRNNRRTGRGPYDNGPPRQQATHVGDSVDYRNFSNNNDGKGAGKGKNNSKGKGKGQKGKNPKGGKAASNL